ncbi:MAG: twin-arginine translocase TatA/TatE family subunit [Candidatus Acidiferrales bacterium]
MLSIPHLIIIFVVALVVFGPQKLPELARNFGKIMAEFKRATADLRGTFEDHLRELERESQALEQKKLDAQRALEAAKAAAPTEDTVPTSSPSSSEVESNPLASSEGVGQSLETLGERAAGLSEAVQSLEAGEQNSPEASPKPAEDNAGTT